MSRGIRLLAAVGVLLALWNAVLAAPIDGKWKVTVYDTDQEVDLVLLEISGKDSPEFKVLSAGAPILKNAAIRDVEQKDGLLSFKIAGLRTFQAVVKVPEDKDAKVIRGVLVLPTSVQPLLLERTEVKGLDSEKFIRSATGADLLNEVRSAKGLEEAQTAFKKLEEKHAGSPLLYSGSRNVLGAAIRGGEKGDITAALARVQKEAALYGPRLAANLGSETARNLLRAKKLPEMALELAQQNMKNIGKDSTTEQVQTATELIVEALKANNLNDEAKKFEAQLAAIEKKLDEEFEKANLNFEIKPYEGRKAKSSRVAVVELFTGAQCPPCVSADIAFDACVKAFKPSDAVFLQYHLHIPGPDALTNPATVARADYYGETIGGTPTALLNGNETEPLGGGRGDGEDRYKTLREAVAKALETEDAAKIALDVKRDGDKINIEARVEDVAKPSDKLKLRLVLIEDVVKYLGRNGQRLHHHVVRDFPGGVAGLAVKDKTATRKATVSLPELKEGLTKYLDEFTARGQNPFADQSKPVDLKKLKVVALLQLDDSKQILHAIQVDVPDAK